MSERAGLNEQKINHMLNLDAAAALTGIEPGQMVRVVATESVDDIALTVYYKTSDGCLLERMLLRTDEATPALAENVGVSIPRISLCVPALWERGRDINAERHGSGWRYTLRRAKKPTANAQHDFAGAAQ